MNLFAIFEQVEKLDPEVYSRLDTRRRAMREFANMGKKITMAALPAALAAMTKKAYGQSQNAITDVLNFALALEHLEYEFYRAALAAGNLIPAGAATGAITTLRDHELAHVNLLAGALNTTFAASKPNIDLTGGGGTGDGPFASALTDYDVFLVAAQTFEDTGVRAYKGQVTNLIADNAVLTTAVQIHSVEARHASHIRQMRAARGASVDPWITGKDPGAGSSLNPLIQASYNGEEVTSQAGVNIVTTGSVSADAASESFDEPLTKEATLAIVGTPGTNDPMKKIFFY